MARLRATVEGRDRVKKRILALGPKATDGVRQAILDGALAVDRSAKDSIQHGAKSGIVYQKYKPRRTHRASAPGESPATDQGKLVAGITVVMDGDGLGASVESRAGYSRELEFGTTKMGARPFLVPALEKLRPKISKMIRDAIEKAGSAS